MLDTYFTLVHFLGNVQTNAVSFLQMTPAAQLATSAAAVASAATASATSEAVARAWPHCQVAQQLHLGQTQAEQVSTRMNQGT